ncbi:MAG TPA: hypothetical protein VHV08_10355 [Pirellulales bacterium]|nr:hypothetical protein [Pirellulales bacterium]
MASAIPTFAAPLAPQGSSGRAAREEAVQSIPMDKIAPGDKEKILATISGTSIFRRLPIQVTACDPDLYLFLVRHPEVIVNIWEVMKISNVALARTGENSFRAADGAGTLCTVKYCYSNHDTQVIFAEGSYDGPLFSRPVRAKCLLVLKSGYMRETNGRYYVTSRLDTFIQIEHAGVELLAKTLQPLVNRSADYNFIETAAFVGTVSRAAEVNAAGVSRLAQKLTNLEPNTRDRFAQIALEVGRKARQRDALQAAAPDGPTPLAEQHSLVERR